MGSWKIMSKLSLNCFAADFYVMIKINSMYIKS